MARAPSSSSHLGSTKLILVLIPPRPSTRTTPSATIPLPRHHQPWPHAALSTRKRQSWKRMTPPRKSQTSAPPSQRELTLSYSHMLSFIPRHLLEYDNQSIKYKISNRSQQGCHCQAPRLLSCHDYHPYRLVLCDRPHSLQRYDAAHICNPCMPTGLI